MDNRPLKFEEFEKKMGKTLFVSATPAEYELEKSGPPVELITRPTGLLDPEVGASPYRWANAAFDGRKQKKPSSEATAVLVTTLTKRMAEDLGGLPC